MKGWTRKRIRCLYVLWETNSVYPTNCQNLLVVFRELGVRRRTKTSSVPGQRLKDPMSFSCFMTFVIVVLGISTLDLGCWLFCFLLHERSWRSCLLFYFSFQCSSLVSYLCSLFEGVRELRWSQLSRNYSKITYSNKYTTSHRNNRSFGLRIREEKSTVSLCVDSPYD